MAKVLVVGDTSKWSWAVGAADNSRMPGGAVISTVAATSGVSLGMAGWISLQIQAIDRTVQVMLGCCVGNDSAGMDVRNTASNSQLSCEAVQWAQPTIQRTTLLRSGGGSQMDSVPASSDEAATQRLVQSICSVPVSLLADVAAVVAVDYGCGTITQEVWTCLYQLATSRGIPLLVFTTSSDMLQFNGASAIVLPYAAAMQAVAGNVHPGLAGSDTVEHSLACCQLIQWVTKSAMVCVLLPSGICCSVDPSAAGRMFEREKEAGRWDLGYMEVCVAGIVVAMLQRKPIAEAMQLATQAADLVGNADTPKLVSSDQLQTVIRDQQGAAGKLHTTTTILQYVQARRRERPDHPIAAIVHTSTTMEHDDVELCMYAGELAQEVIVFCPAAAAVCFSQLMCVTAVDTIEPDQIDRELQRLKPDLLVHDGRRFGLVNVHGANAVAAYGGEVVFFPSATVK